MFVYCTMENLLRINDILKERGKTQQWLADKIGRDRITVNNMATGKTWPKANTLVAMSLALDVDIRELFHPTKEGKEKMEELFKRDENGNYQKIGYLAG